jgi:hypothetical protein
MKKTCKLPESQAESLPKVTLGAAEKVLRDIARRNGEVIRKRRSRTLKEYFGPGYGILDPQRNFWLSSAQTHDGCDLSLADLAKWYEDTDHNTPWQRIVIKAILAGKVSD